MLPLNREENFLAEIAGDPDANEDMIPRTRKEIRLNEIANRIGHLGGSGFDAFVLYDDDTVTYTALHGDYTTLFNKLSNDEPVFIVVGQRFADNNNFTHVTGDYVFATYTGIVEGDKVFFTVNDDLLYWDSDNNITQPLQ